VQLYQGNVTGRLVHEKWLKTNKNCVYVCVFDSPMSLSSNSNNVSKQYLASSSDASACDSPVFSLKLPSKLLRNKHSTGDVKVRD